MSSENQDEAVICGKETVRATNDAATKTTAIGNN